MNLRRSTPWPIPLAGSALACSALLPWQLAWFCAIAAVIVLGVPHGALDVEVARPVLRRRFGRPWFLIFSLPYLALFALVLLSWRVFPLPTLALFLAMSVWHFGAEDAPSKAILGILSRGGLPIAMPVLAHPSATALVFGTVAHVPLSAPPPWLFVASIVWLASSIGVSCIAVARRDWHTPTVTTALMLMFILLPPLTAFAIYFICLHAPAHTIALIDDRKRAPRVNNMKAAWARAMPMTGLTLLIGATLWPFYTGNFALRSVALTIQMLSALTLPHMLLNAGLTGFGKIKVNSPLMKRKLGLRVDVKLKRVSDRCRTGAPSRY